MNAEENNKAVIEKALKRTFSPEFLNRIDDVVIFNSLSKENIFEIIDILMKGVMKRLSNLGFNLELTPDAKDFIAEKGYDVQFGARPLHRAIQKYLEDELAEEILSMNIKNGDTRLLTPGDGEVENVVLSTDKTEIIYTTNTSDTHRRHIWKVNISGGKPVQLSKGDGIEWFTKIRFNNNFSMKIYF